MKFFTSKPIWLYAEKDNSGSVKITRDPTDCIVLYSSPIRLINKLETMCIEYSEMKNEAGAKLLFDIQELTKALNAINCSH